MRLVLLAVACAGAAGVLPGPGAPLAAQDEASDSVPRALAEALAGRGVAAARILVGEAPPGWDLRIESGMELLGSAERENGSAVMVLATDRGATALRDALVALLEGQGWEPWEEGPGRSSMGFVPAGAGPGSVLLCRDGRETVGLQAVEGEPGLVYLDYRDRGGDAMVPCDLPGRERWDALRATIPVPELEGPEGVALASGGTTTGSGTLGTTAFLRGDVTLEALEAHFGRQLRAQGWRPLGGEGGAATGAVRSSLWERPIAQDETGGDGPGPWLGMLTLSRSGEAPVWVRFSAYRTDERRHWMGGGGGDGDE